MTACVFVAEFGEALDRARNHHVSGNIAGAERIYHHSIVDHSDQAEVAVSPGRGFGEIGEGYLRLDLIENEQKLRQAVRQIGRCLKTSRME